MSYKKSRTLLNAPSIYIYILHGSVCDLGFMLYAFIKQYIYIYCKVCDHSWGRPEDSLFNSYYTGLYGRVLLLSLDCTTLPLIRTLYCWVWSKEVSSTIFKVFGMTRSGIEPKSPGPIGEHSAPLGQWAGLIGFYIYIHIYTLLNRLIGLVCRVLANRPIDLGLIPGCVVYIYIYSLVWFYGIASLVYFMPNPAYIYKLNMICEYVLWITFSTGLSSFSTQLNSFKYFYVTVSF